MVSPLCWRGARFGIDKGSRRALGYHVPLKDRSVQVYSRGYQAAPMRRLHDVLKAIASGHFDPDATRAGLFKEVVTTEGPDASFPMYRLGKNKMLHKQTAGATKSICSKSSSSDSKVWASRVCSLTATSVCRRCFPSMTLDSVTLA